MTRPSKPPELFAEPPVRSDFSRRRLEPAPVAWRRVLALVVPAVLVVAGCGYLLLARGSSSTGEIPTIKAEGPLKQKPENPGGIDIPHQDVMVFQQIDSAKDHAAAQQGGVEHLLPPPESPQAPAARVTAPAMLAPNPEPAPTSVVEKVTSDGRDLSPLSTSSVPAASGAPAMATVQPSAAVPDEGLIHEKPVVPQPVVPQPGASTPSPLAEKEAPAAAPVQASKAAPHDKEIPAKKVVADVKKPEPKKAEVKKAPVAVAVEKPEATHLPSSLFTTGELPKEAAKPAAQASKNAGGKGAFIQLASLPDKASAEAEAQRLQAKYASALGDTQVHVSKIDLPAGTFYRVQSGSLSSAQAKALCAALARQKAACMVRQP